MSPTTECPMTEDRPDPDELLQLAASDTRSHKGQLKIFFGACAGVGKTYAMLQEAHQRQAAGVQVAIGIVETHDRPDTVALLDGLPVIAQRIRKEGGRTQSELRGELDLDAALASPHQLLIVDELAHTNARGSRHTKRWQDVLELLDAGFDVYTALNVQHLDSLNDIVSGIIGVRIRETVPDRVFDQAADVVLVDLPTDDLLTRLATGKIYLPPSIEAARRNFFRRGNLTAMRELALRRVADRVNADVRSYRISHAIHTVWPTQDRVMVCVSADPSQEMLIREGSRLAQRLQCQWTVVHVDLPDEHGKAQAQEALLHLDSCARHMGVELVRIAGQHPAQVILDYARQRNATQLMLGNTSAKRILPFRSNVVDEITKASPGIGLILLPTEATHARPSAPQRSQKRLPPATSLLLATLACGLTTGIAAWLLQVFDLSNVVMLFLVMVVFTSLRLGRLAGAWSSILSVAFFDFFFVPPKFSFSVGDTQYVFTFALMLVVAFTIGQLAAKLRAEASVAREGEQRAAALVRVIRDLAGAIALEQIIGVCRETLEPLFKAQVVLLVPDGADDLQMTRPADFVDISVARWCFDHMKAAGRGTQTLNAAPALYIPLKGPMAPRGVLVLLPTSDTPNEPGSRLLSACCAAIAQALERIHYVNVAQDTIVRMEGEKMRNTLLSAVSHDLKTPLTAIRGLAETLERPAQLVENERVEIARAIRTESDELHRLVSNLLDLARMQSEGVTLHMEWHSLCDIVGSALARAASTIAPRTVVTNLPADLPLVEVDATLMDRVLGNLFDNAAKYTPDDSTLTLSSHCSDNDIVLAVQDDGPGLPPGCTQTLFEPFTRGKKESSTAGVGLGLTLCRRIVEAHGGSIIAKPGPSRGVIFEIHLPRRTPPSVTAE